MPIVAPLLALDVIVLVLWTIAAALAIALIMDKLSSILAGVPWVGGKLSDAVKSMAKAITNAAGTLEHGIDSIVGAAWHALSRYVDKLFNQFVTHSAIILHLAQIVGSGLYSVSGLRSLVRSISHVAHAAYSGVKTLEREFHGIEHRVKTLEREIGAGIGDDVRVHVKALERWEKAAKAQLKADEKAITQTLPGELTQLENFIKAIPGTRYLDWVAGIVTAALGLEVWNLLRCNFLRNLWGSRGCGLWQGLDDLLSLFFDAVIFADFCGLLPEAEALFADLEGPLVGLVATAADAACAHPPPGWVELAAPALSLPAVYYTGPVPGN